MRTLAPGTTFTLHGQAQIDTAALKNGTDARSFVILRVVHLAHNNLGAEAQTEVADILGQSELEAQIVQERGHSLHSVGTGKGERPLYRNRIDVIPAKTPYRANRVDGHGLLQHPRPTVQGQQTAIVVGPEGAVIHTDRDHRIKVQFHWQRGAGDAHLSHSRLNHPTPDGHTGAPANDHSGTWVRIATPMAPIAGANWGSVAVPRIGSEVIIDFMEGDIDRPVVIGSLYNGRGVPDAQQNQVIQGAGVATGNAPAWFPGDAGGHAHPATLSGFKTQAMSASQTGTGAYNQLVFDDSAGQSRLSLQNHAGPHQGTAELNLGSLRHQSDNQRLNKTGFGAELKTAHGGALRAGAGLLLSTDARPNASGTQLDSREARAQIEQSVMLQTALASTAQKHHAMLKNDKGQAEPEASKLPAIKQMTHSGEVIEAATNNVTAYLEPQIQLSSPAGIAATTPADAIFSANSTSSITAGQDINFAAQGNYFQTVKSGISLFTYGKASAKDKPNQETGIKLHAASGNISSQSQSDETRITADKAVTVASISKTITVAAKKHVLMTAQGAYLKLEGGNIMLHGPGKILFKATMKELAGPASSNAKLPFLPGSAKLKNFIELNYRWDDLQSMVGAPYAIKFDGGVTIEGKLDANGFARIENTPNSIGVVTYGEDERDAKLRKNKKPNQVHGSKANSDEEAQTILETYLKQEAAYYKDNFFPDELEAMGGDGPDSELEYDFHYDDYKYRDEETLESIQAEKSYRQEHDQEGNAE